MTNVFLFISGKTISKISEWRLNFLPHPLFYLNGKCTKCKLFALEKKKVFLANIRLKNSVFTLYSAIFITAVSSEYYAQIVMEDLTVQIH